MSHNYPLVTRIQHVLFMLILTLMSHAAYAAAGDPDTTFGTSGVAETAITGTGSEPFNVVIQPDGKILLAGALLTSSNLYDGVLVRYNADGSADTGFGTNGVTELAYNTTTLKTGYVFFAAAVLSDGHILVAGTLTNGNDGLPGKILLARYNSNGSLDTTFGTQGMTLEACNSSDTTVTRMVVTADSKILIAGQCNVPDGHHYIARFTANGSLDTSFGQSGFATNDVSGVGTEDEVHGLVLAPDGSIYVAGGYDTNADPSTSQVDSFIAKYTSDGVLDASFGTGGIVTVQESTVDADIFQDLAMQPDGKLVAVGIDYGTQDLSYVMRFKSDGSVDSSFGTSGTQTLYSGVTSIDLMSILALPDGLINLAGYSGNNSAVFARLTAAGTLDGTYAGGGLTSFNGSYYSARALTAASQADGRIVAGLGLQATSGSVSDLGAVRLDGNTLDLQPDAFSFSAKTDVALSTTVTSGMITVAGLDSGVSVPVSVSGGEYQINSGAWTDNQGFVQDGDQLAVRQTSASSGSSSSTTTLTIGGYVVPGNSQIVLGSSRSADFTTTTKVVSSSSGGGGGGGYNSISLLLLLLLAARKHLRPARRRQHA